MSDARPAVTGVLETVLYVTDLDRSERFYSDVLGFRLLSREPGRSLFYRAGTSVLLLFNATVTLRPDLNPPPHGATGSVHTCFLATETDYERWKDYLRSRGVTILSELNWHPGRSFYFHDPDGNLLEIANRDIWPQ